MRNIHGLTLAGAVLLAAAVAAPAAAADRDADARHEEITRLLTVLRSAPDEAAAALLENRIRALWVRDGSPAATLLMTRGERNMQATAIGEAIDDFDAVLALEPGYAEGYNHRAAARAAAGDLQGAIRDIEVTLTLDPHHFSALQGLSHIAEEQGNWRGALEAWQKALDIDPRTPGGLDRLDMLQKKAEGEPT